MSEDSSGVTAILNKRLTQFMGNPPWIRSESSKAKLIQQFLNGPVMEWRRKCGLNGASTTYDFFLGCYGNPDRSETIFIAEIPSLLPKEIVLEAYPVDTAWTSAWKITESDLIFRVALKMNNFIPTALSDEPWTWHCWITDFVKCAEYTNRWNKMRKNGEDKSVLDYSSRLIKEELTILQPKRIVFVGGRSKRYFHRYSILKGINNKIVFDEVPHYALRNKTHETIHKYYEEFHQMTLRINNV